MFSILTNQKILDDLCRFQSKVTTVEPMIYAFKKGSGLMNTLKVQGIFKKQEDFENTIRNINKEYNGNSKTVPNKDNLNMMFFVAYSNDKQLPYLGITNAIRDKDIKKIEKSLQLELTKLTDNLYRLDVHKETEKE